jgi:AcrR family transcriptional regulator
MGEELTIRQKRTLAFFIEAAQKIIERDGFDNVSIRKIAKEAGYNSATIYNYYKDLDHLLQFACVQYLIGYQNKLTSVLKDLTDPRDIYFTTWKIFASECHARPKVYYHLFFSKHKNSIDETFYRYIEIFDIKYELVLKDEIFSFITLPNLFDRHTILLDSLAKSNIITDKNIKEKAEIIILTFESMLNYLKIDPEYYSKEEFTDKIILYSRILLGI